MTEFEKFDKTMRKLIKVSHKEIKSKLEAEKSAKKQQREERLVRNGKSSNTK